MTEINAFGYIEVIGFVTAIEAADAMVKSANVRIYTEQGVDPAMITVIVEGDLAACRAAVNAGVAAAERIGKVLSHLVHGRPSDDCAHLVTHLLKQSKDSNWQINTLTPKPKKPDAAKIAVEAAKAPEKAPSPEPQVVKAEVVQAVAVVAEPERVVAVADSTLTAPVAPIVAAAKAAPVAAKRKTKKPSAHHHK